ncbi:MAG: sigma-70 family RNA polymerase sigma factor [Ruminococcaceae bacterium]|nr:sigma-70 family RNA polymerase sigma factor [Oscillospiraceae bacterium]
MDKNSQLLEKLKNGENEAEKELLESNMGLVRSIAYRFSGMTAVGVDWEDLCQIGSIGLLKAIRNFDTERGLMFSTYAVPLIIGEIRKFLRDDGAVKVSRSIKEKYFRIKKEAARLSVSLLREPTVSELCAATGFTSEDVIMALESGIYPTSLDESENDELPLSERVAAEEKTSQIDMIALKEALSRLDGADRKLIALRYFSAKTQVETANILGMTQVQVSRREKKIIENLKRSMG